MDGSDRILDARLDHGFLNVVSTDFRRLHVSTDRVRALVNATPETLKRFELDQDGAFIYWPELDAHLGWEQLLQAVDPQAAQKAKQKSQEFNVRYGPAIRRLRE